MTIQTESHQLKASL